MLVCPKCGSKLQVRSKTSSDDGRVEKTVKVIQCPKYHGDILPMCLKNDHYYREEITERKLK